MLNQEDLRLDVESCSVGVEARRPSLYIATNIGGRAVST